MKVKWFSITTQLVFQGNASILAARSSNVQSWGDISVTYCSLQQKEFGLLISDVLLVFWRHFSLSLSSLLNHKAAAPLKKALFLFSARLPRVGYLGSSWNKWRVFNFQNGCRKAPSFEKSGDEWMTRVESPLTSPQTCTGSLFLFAWQSYEFLKCNQSARGRQVFFF